MAVGRDIEKIFLLYFGAILADFAKFGQQLIL